MTPDAWWPVVLALLAPNRPLNGTAAMTDSDLCVWDTRARPGEIRRSAEGLRTITGVLLGHRDNVGAVLNEVALSFSEVVSSAIAAQIENNVAALEAAVECTEYGYGVSTAWAEDVESFITARAELMARWEALAADDFGVPATNGLPNADAEMAEEMYFDRDRDVATARGLARTAYEAEGQRLWEWFQVQVGEKARLFREGPTAANLALLGSYLGGSATTLWPEIAPPLVVGAAEGAAAGATVIEGLDGTAGPEAVADALTALAIITRRSQYGYEPTPGELAYLEAFYATMGDRILDLPAYLASTSGPIVYDQDAPPRYVPPVPFEGTPELVATLTMAAANGLLVLSRPTTRPGDDDHDGYERLPSWLRETLAVDDIDPNDNPYAHFERLTGLGDLLGSSTVEAGTGLSRELAGSVSWMIEYADSREDPVVSSGIADDLRAEIARSAPALLDVVARDDEASFDLLTGSEMPDGYSPADYFTDIYAFDWTMDDGAAAAGLTDFIPVWATSEDPAARSRAEDAMFDLVQIVTGDASFERLMDGVGVSGVPAESAVGQVNPAITRGFVTAMAPYMEQFAGPQNYDDPTTSGDDPTQLGNLDFETRVHFMTLIGTDPDSGAALAGVAYAHEQQELYDYAASGNAEQNGGNVGRIRGLVDAGLINAGMDAGADQAAAAAEAGRTRQTGMDIAQGIAGSIPVPGASALVGTVFAIFDHQSASGDAATESVSSAAQTVGRTEAERRYDTAQDVVTGLVLSGQIPPSSVPTPFVGPVVEDPSTEALTQALVNAARAAGYDLTPILDRIESAYSDADLVGERDG